MISAAIILDSINSHGNRRMRTFKLRYPWFIHGECKTHRVVRVGDNLIDLMQEISLMDDPGLSRNASSNRAIPLRKMLEEARSDELRAEPVYWGAEQKGMEPGGELDAEGIQMARWRWKQAALAAADHAEGMMTDKRDDGHMLMTHKSLCNRLLMPFTHANVVVSGTEWDNFFGLRLDKAADPTMRALAEAMWRAQEESTPTVLQPGQWHLPFVDAETIEEYCRDKLSADEMRAVYGNWPNVDMPYREKNQLVKISVARCARVSYESFETGKRSTVEEDLKLYERLVGAQPLHASPAEHQATPDDDRWWHRDQHGNLVGWRQYRKMLPGEAVAPLPKEYRT